VKLSHQDYDTVSVITLSGDYTADDVDQFTRSTTDRRNAGVRHIILDCENLEFVDSKGLESWLRLQEALGSGASGGVGGGQLRLIRLDDTVRRILALTRLDLAFEVHPTVESAVRSLR
jgi:anti-anti-sigma factor